MDMTRRTMVLAGAAAMGGLLPAKAETTGDAAAVLGTIAARTSIRKFDPKRPVDDALMLLAVRGKRVVRKIKKLEGSKLMLQSYDRELVTETVMWAEIQILGRCVKLHRSL